MIFCNNNNTNNNNNNVLPAKRYQKYVFSTFSTVYPQQYNIFLIYYLLYYIIYAYIYIYIYIVNRILTIVFSKYCIANNKKLIAYYQQYFINNALFLMYN